MLYFSVLTIKNQCNMKAHLKSLFAAALAVTLSSCEKSAENVATLQEKSTKSISEIVYPLLGNEMSTSILPKRNNLPKGVLTITDYYPDDEETNKIELIDLICDEYLQQTKKLDISNIQEGKYQTGIYGGGLNIGFTTRGDQGGEGFSKLSNGPKGWWTHWNYSPYTESEYPDVLFARDKMGNSLNRYTMNLREPVTVFGFEVAPNTIGEDVVVSVLFREWDTYRSLDICRVVQTISSPSGARLIAIKSEVPFQRIEISLDSKSAGAAISNIRYRLAE
jgi:hypothetical protein